MTIFSTSSLAFILLSTLSFQAKGWETEKEAASQLVELISSPKQFGVTTLSTVYPSDHADETLRGMIASGAEYYAPCFDNGDLLMLGMPVSQNWRNVLPPSSNSNVTLSINSNPDPKVADPRHSNSKLSSRPGPSSWDPERPSWRRGMPSKIRTQLMGSVEVLNDAEFKEGLGWVEVKREEQVVKTEGSDYSSSIFQKVWSNLAWLSNFQTNPIPSHRGSLSSPSAQTSEPSDLKAQQHSNLSKCYLDFHPDSSHWTPGSDDSDSPHKAMWVRIRIEKIYSVGGFGDEHRIGFVQKEAWKEAWQNRKNLI